MAFLAQLWLPIVVSAVVVFILSAATHMALPWRKKEWGRFAGQDALQASITGLAPGQYSFPVCPDPKEPAMGKEWMARWEKGPSGWLVVAAPGPMTMGKMLAQTFLVYLAVSFLVAYVASLSLGPTTPALTIVRVTSTVGLLAHGVGTIFNSIWYHRPWRVYAMDLFDAVVYAFAMAGVFGWLWPR
jgi:hypothetical protein